MMLNVTGRSPYSPLHASGVAPVAAPSVGGPGSGSTAFQPVAAAPVRPPGALDRMHNGGYFSLPRSATPQLAAAASAAWEALEAQLGDLPRGQRPVGLSERDIGDLQRLAAGLARIPRSSQDDRVLDLRKIIRDQWLADGLSVWQLEVRLEVALETGYALVKEGLYAEDAADRLDWSDQDLREVRELLLALPPLLRFIPDLFFLTRDKQGDGEDAAVAELQRRIDGIDVDSLSEVLLVHAGKLFLKLLDTGLIGSEFGTAYFGSKEVRLYSELFEGSRFPGLGRMLAYTLVHEIAHHLLRRNPELLAAWTTFYEQTGKADASNGYAASSVDEAFGVAVGMLAVAPEMLRDKSPATHAWLTANLDFGDLSPFHGHGIEGRMIDLVYGLGDVAAAHGGN